MIKHFLICLLAVTVISCTKSSEVDQLSDPLIGIWQAIDYGDDGSTTYKRVNKLKDTIAIIFEDGGVFKTWDFGFCGTPPVHYFFTEGTYERLPHEVTLDIEFHFYLDKAVFEIVELSDERLILKRVE